MLKIAESYYTAIVESHGDAAPFADDCVRHENAIRPPAIRRRRRPAAEPWVRWVVTINGAWKIADPRRDWCLDCRNSGSRWTRRRRRAAHIYKIQDG
jgi:hypothetical protein